MRFSADFQSNLRHRSFGEAWVYSTSEPLRLHRSCCGMNVPGSCGGTIHRPATHWPGDVWAKDAWAKRWSTYTDGDRLAGGSRPQKRERRHIVFECAIARELPGDFENRIAHAAGVHTLCLAQRCANTFNAKVIHLGMAFRDSARCQHKRVTLAQGADLGVMDCMGKQAQGNSIRRQQNDV